MKGWGISRGLRGEGGVNFGVYLITIKSNNTQGPDSDMLSIRKDPNIELFLSKQYKLYTFFFHKSTCLYYSINFDY